MPYKTGKLKGELLVSEIRKLVRLHNKLSKIKIPPRSSRDDIIKIVEDNGYKIDHKNHMAVSFCFLLFEHDIFCAKGCTYGWKVKRHCINYPNQQAEILMS